MNERAIPFLSILSLLCISCGDGDSEDARCEMSGDYTAHYEEISGDCGPRPDEVINDIDIGGQGFTKDCYYSSTYHDRCLMDIEYAHCNDQDLCDGCTYYFEGAIHFDPPEGSTANAVILYRVYNPTEQICESEYNATYTKIP
jgi:hypothetical protein